MNWSACCDTVEVYEPGITHWIIAALGEKSANGYVTFSKELLAQLNAIMEG